MIKIFTQKIIPIFFIIIGSLTYGQNNTNSIGDYNFQRILLISELTDGLYVITNDLGESFLGDKYIVNTDNSYFQKSTEVITTTDNKVKNIDFKYIWNIETKKDNAGNVLGRTISRYDDTSNKLLFLEASATSKNISFNALNQTNEAQLWVIEKKDSDVEDGEPWTITNKKYTNRSIQYSGTDSPIGFSGYSSNNRNGRNIKLYKVVLNNLTIWNGINWSNGEPTVNNDVILLANLNPSKQLLEANHLYINENVTIPSGTTVRINGYLTVQNDKTLILSDKSAFIQNNPNAKSTNNIIVKRNSKPLSRYEMMFWSSPVKNQNIFQLSPKTITTRFLEYNSDGNTWDNNNLNANSIFEPAKAIIFRTPNDFPAIGIGKNIFEASFKGSLNNGIISIPGKANKFTSVGNPYSSPISIELFFDGNASVQSIYVWSATNSDYPGGASNFKANNYFGWSDDSIEGNNLGIATGFLVKLGRSNANIIFNNEMRVNEGAEGGIISYRTIEEDKYWLALYKDNTKLNSTLIAHSYKTTNDLDEKYEAIAVGLPEGIYSKIDSEYLLIQSRAELENQNLPVTIALNLPEEGTYSIVLSKIKGAFATDERLIYLKDKTLNTITNLSEKGSYTFTNSSGILDNRFEIFYSESNLSTPPVQTVKEDVTVYTTNNMINIDSSELINSVKVYDFSGQLIAEKNNVNKKSTKINLSSKKQGLVVITDLINGQSISKKILFK